VSSPAKAVRLTTIAVSAAYALLLYLAGVHLAFEYKKIIAYLPSAAGLLILVFDWWAWKWRYVRLLHKRPRLAGLWSVELRPNERSLIPRGGNWGPIEAYVVIEQTFWSISIRQYTAESSSASRATTWLTKMDASPVILNFTYDNVPQLEHQPRSQRHVGACEFNMARGKPTSMTGTYFTDRFTAGAMSLTFRNDHTEAATFQNAQDQAAAS
jgi:hypothetical protein